MPNTREKLIEMLKQFDRGCPKEVSCRNCEYQSVGAGCSVYARADHLIANGVTVAKWIPVTERLPQEKGERCKNVIMFMDDGIVTVGWLNEDMMSAFYLDTRNDFVSRVPMSRCTHWMPLPEPPKGE